LSQPVGSLVVTVVVGLLVAGPLAAVALVATPPDWRGPWVAVLAVLVGVGLVALLRRESPSDRT